MGYVAKVGDIVKSGKHTYKIIREINKGGFADAYKAKAEDGTMIFLKQYKSPSKLVPWYSKYCGYVTELNNRLKADVFLSTSTIFANEIFQAKVYKPDGINTWTRNECFFQAFPFVTGNTNLKDMIDKGAAFDWERRVYACTVFAFALRKLHDADIVHCDLKPENVQVKLDSSIAMKYRPLLIDMDWSILSDKMAPWHGKQGYVGTAGYTSPEHLRDQAPVEASDVFTASIIFCQVLAGKYPFASHLESDDLAKYILSGKNDFNSKATSIPFYGKTPDRLKDLIVCALDENPKNRPTMKEIHLEFMTMCKSLGSTKTISAKLSAVKPLKRLAPKACSAAKEPAIPPDLKLVPKPIDVSPNSLTLVGNRGTFSTKIDFDINKKILDKVTFDSKYANPNWQFKILNSPTSGWFIAPNNLADNLTCLNGQPIKIKSTKLKNGDIICLKGRISGKTAMNLKVKIS